VLLGPLGRILAVAPPAVDDTMMALLPLVGWADVATKDDLRSLEARILVQIHKEVASLSKTMVVSIVGSIATVAALAFGAAHLV
jgi:hypothetical protein